MIRGTGRRLQKSGWTTWLSSAAARLILVLVGLAMGLAVLEVAARIVYPVRQPVLEPAYGVVPHERLGWFHKPNAEGWFFNSGQEFFTYVRINSRGLRDREYPYKKPRGVYRILLLGDSFAEGMQVDLEHTFAKVLEELLNQAGLGQRVEVINAGVVAYSQDLELLLLREEGYRYEPDLVLLAAFPYNDTPGNLVQWVEWNFTGTDRPYFTLEGGQLILHNFPAQNQSARPTEEGDPGLEGTQTPSSLFMCTKLWLEEHSHLYVVSRNLIRSRVPRLVHLLSAMGLMADSTNSLQGGRHWVPMPLAHNAQRWDEAWKLTQRLLLALRDESAGHGAEFAVVILPSAYPVHDEFWVRFQDAYPEVREMDLDVEQPTREFDMFLRERGIAHLQLLPIFRHYTRCTGATLYFSFDGHLNKEGHRVVAEAMATWLLGQGLVGE